MSFTYEEQRTEQEKAIDADVLARVKRGFAWLEETHGMGWEDKIDMATLNLADGSQCVLGQVYGTENEMGYFKVRDIHPEMGDWDLRRDLGFTTKEDWEALQEAWEFVLRPCVTKP